MAKVLGRREDIIGGGRWRKGLEVSGRPGEECFLYSCHSRLLSWPVPTGAQRELGLGTANCHCLLCQPAARHCAKCFYSALR